MIVSAVREATAAMTPKEEAAYRHQAAIVARDALRIGADYMNGARAALVKALSCVPDDLTTARHLSDSIAALIEAEASTRNRTGEMEKVVEETERTVEDLERAR